MTKKIPVESDSDKLLAKDIKERGAIVADWFDEGVRIIIMRGGASYCVYLGIPESHPLAGNDYDNVPVDCHGGLTFATSGDGKAGRWPAGFFWYGYDYAHAGDKTVYDYQYGDALSDDHDWTLAEVKQDAWFAIYSFKKLMKLCENVASKRAT